MISTVIKISWINLKRDRVALVLSFVLPLAFFSIFASVFRGMDQGSDVDAMIVLEDPHPAAARLVELLEAAPRVAIVGAARSPTRENAQGAVRAGLVDAAVVIPSGFGDALRLPGAPPVRVDVLVDTSNPMVASVVTGALQSMSLELGYEVLVAKLGFADDDVPRLSFDVVDVLGRSGKEPSVAFFASGIGVMFLMFAVSGRSAILLEERESGVLVRMLSARLGMTRLLVGRWIFLTLLGVVQVTAMFVWGSLMFGLELWVPRHLTGFAVLTPVTAATAAGFGLVLSAMCRTRTQLNGVAAVVILILSALGGNMFPGFLMPEGLRALGLATFNAWALAGYQKIFWYEQSVSQLAPQLLVLAGYCGSFLFLARVLARRWEQA